MHISMCTRGAGAPPPPAAHAKPADAPAAKPAEVLQRVWQLARARHYSRRTEKAYASWVRRFLAFHNYRDPAMLGSPEVKAYL